MTTDALLIILLLVALVLAWIVVPQWRLRRATSQVLRIFKDHNAVNIKNAKALDELGLRLQRTMLEGIITRRDYKRYALQAMMKAEIVQVTEDGRLYLSEEKLLSSKFYKSQSVFR